MSEPRRVLVDWDYGADGIWWCRTSEERTAPPRSLPNGSPGVPPRQGWKELLPEALLADLAQWNRECERADRSESGDSPQRQERESRARVLAERVRESLGDDGQWEVLYKLGSEVLRVYPPGRWSVWTWTEELLGYPPKRRPPS
jgi:hypothetical protein